MFEKLPDSLIRFSVTMIICFAIVIPVNLYAGKDLHLDSLVFIIAIGCWGHFLKKRGRENRNTQP